MASSIPPPSKQPKTAMKLHPEFLKKNGKVEFVVLPYDEFLKLQELLADAEDVLALRQDKREEADKPTVPLAELRKRFGLTD